MAKKQGYDAITGGDQAAVNGMLAQIYTAVYPAIFSGSFPIGSDGIASIGYNIPKPPVVAFTGDVYPPESGVAVFSIAFPVLEASVDYEDGSSQTGTGRIAGSALADVDPNGVLTFRIESLVVDIPADPALTALLNKWFTAPLMRLLNRALLAGIKIPPIEWEGVAMTPGPALLADHGYLMIYSALTSTGLPVISGTAGGWPQGRPFTSADEPLLDQIASALFDTYAAQEWKAQEKIDIGVCELKLTAQMKAGLTTAKFDLQPGKGSSVRATIKAEAIAKVGAKCSVIDASLEVGLKATADVTMQAWIDDQELKLRVLDIHSLSIVPHATGVPSELEELVGEIEAFCTATFTQWLKPFIQALVIPICSIPAIKITVDGTKYKIVVQDAWIDQIKGPSDKPLLVAYGDVVLKG